MAVGWDSSMVGVIVAVSLALPIVWKGAVQTKTSIQKKTRKVPRLVWNDVLDGKLHECISIGGMGCSHSQSHPIQKECWKSSCSLSTIFNRSWKNLKQDPKYAEHIPEDLPLGSFLRTDARTILAFVLCTARETRYGSWNPEQGLFGSTKLRLEVYKGIQFCHIQGQFQEVHQHLTNTEVARMLEGYPPWYRQTLTTPSRINLAFPLNDLKDVSRAGWIVAVGLRDQGRQTQSPLVLYRCQGEPDNPGWRRNGVTYRSAVVRCRDHITRNISPHFPNDAIIKTAVTMLDYLITENTGSGIPLSGSLFRRQNEDTHKSIPPLSRSSCEFVMRDFNKYEPLDDAGVNVYRRILLPTLAAVIYGAYEVIEYLKDDGVEFKFPPGLADFDGEVFLRDCTTRIPAG